SVLDDRALHGPAEGPQVTSLLVGALRHSALLAGRAGVDLAVIDVGGLVPLVDRPDPLLAVGAQQRAGGGAAGIGAQVVEVAVAGEGGDLAGVVAQDDEVAAGADR